MEKYRNWRAELKKCLLDNTRSYMIENFAFQSSLWEMQSELLKMLSSKKYMVVTKSRDVGFTHLMAAYVACEMVLNSDGVEDTSQRHFTIRYMAPNHNMGTHFASLVKSYLTRIPSELYIAENVVVRSKNNEICVGKAILTVKTDDVQFDNIGFSHPYDVIIYDEPVAGKTSKQDFDITNIIGALRLNTSKLIVGGTPNHRVKKWYDVVTDAKNKCVHLIINWATNKNHRLSDDDVPIPVIDNNGNWHLTNEWLRDRRKRYIDIDDFEEEINCKVWREKVIKEYA